MVSKVSALTFCCYAQALPLTELNRQFGNTLNHSIPNGSPRKTEPAALGDMDSDEAAQPDLDVDEMMCAFASFLQPVDRVQYCFPI